MAVNEAADRYVRWLYRYASSRPDLSLLAGVAGAVAVLESRPEDLAEVLHDELPIAMAAMQAPRPGLMPLLPRTRHPHAPARRSPAPDPPIPPARRLLYGVGVAAAVPMPPERRLLCGVGAAAAVPIPHGRPPCDGCYWGEQIGFGSGLRILF